MQKLAIFPILLFFYTNLFSQDIYFPPIIGDDWENIEAETLGWCPEKIDTLYDFLESNNSKAFLILKDGKIVLEKYFGDFDQNSPWYWASAGKSLTAFMVGLTQEDGYLDIEEPSQTYLGTGWTSCSQVEESNISIRYHLSMTTGLDDTVEDVDCTDAGCLQCLAEPGTRWAYHNAPYTLLDRIIEGASGKNLNEYITEKLKFSTGISGNYLPVGYNNVFFSKARSMARYGILILNRGNWNGNQIMQDSSYFNAMVNTSQDLNQSYGYLWWLNGKESFMAPQLQMVFQGSLTPNAPEDMIAAMGLNGQILQIIPSQNLIIVRMGNAPEVNGFASLEFSRQMWEYINGLDCSSKTKDELFKPEPEIHPNPVRDFLNINYPNDQKYNVKVYDTKGRLKKDIKNLQGNVNIDLQALKPGIYPIQIHEENGPVYFKVLLKYGY
jgi:CubicO group peptidase (beta-lactamase class C family)